MSLPPPHPLFVSSPWPGTSRELGWGRGGVAVGHLLSPLLRPNSLTVLIHQICQIPLSYLMGHLSVERTPLSEPQSQRCPRFNNNGASGGWGVAKERRRSLMGGGGAGRENACVAWNTSSLRKNSLGRYTWILPTFLFWIAAIINTLVIRSSLKDWQSMKKECIHARHRYLVCKREIKASKLFLITFDYYSSYFLFPEPEALPSYLWLLLLLFCLLFISWACTGNHFIWNPQVLRTLNIMPTNLN